MHMWCVAILVGFSAFPATAGAETAKTPLWHAGELKRQAFEAAGRHAWKEAGAAFRRSWALIEDHALACSLGIAEWENGYWRGAAEHIALCMKALTPHERFANGSKLEAMLAQARGKTARLTIEVDVEDALVWVDDEEVGMSPLEREVFVDPGAHVVEARAIGHMARHSTVVVFEGEMKRVRIELPVGQEGEDRVDGYFVGGDAVEARPAELVAEKGAPAELVAKKGAPAEPVAKKGAPVVEEVAYVAPRVPEVAPASVSAGSTATRLGALFLWSGVAGAGFALGTWSLVEFYRAESAIETDEVRLARSTWKQPSPCAAMDDTAACTRLESNKALVPTLQLATVASFTLATGAVALVLMEVFGNGSSAPPHVVVSAGAGPGAAGITLNGQF